MLFRSFDFRALALGRITLETPEEFARWLAEGQTLDAERQLKKDAIQILLRMGHIIRFVENETPRMSQVGEDQKCRDGKYDKTAEQTAG